VPAAGEAARHFSERAEVLLPAARAATRLSALDLTYFIKKIVQL
jgi:hypothetical protein